LNQLDSGQVKIAGLVAAAFGASLLSIIIWCWRTYKDIHLSSTFIHSFIPDITPLQVHFCSEALPTTALILCRS